MGPAVIKTLREEHANIVRLLSALEHQMLVFAAGDRPDYDVVQGVADYFLDYPDRCHHPKEDAVFAQMLRTHAVEASTIAALPGEHAMLHDKTRRFRDSVNALLLDSDIPRSVVVGVAEDFIESQRRHIRQEEERFLPLAEQLLTSSDWLRIEEDLAEGADPVFGAKVESDFALLRERLLAWERESECLGSDQAGGSKLDLDQSARREPGA